MSELRTTVCHVGADGLLVERGPTGPRPGDIWFDPDRLGGHLSVGYWALPAPRRPPIVVVLPNGDHFCVDDQQRNRERGFFEPGWEVSGSIEALTVRPSINIPAPNGWHGFLENGILRPA